MFTVKDLTVLYIDSNNEIRNNYARLMRDEGFKVLEADHVSVANDLFRMNQVDFILMDILLPNENGLNFIRELRNKELLIPIIITTTTADKNVLLEAINLDITRYLIKPFKNEDLLDALYVVIRKLFMTKVINFTNLHHGYYYDPMNKVIIRPNGESIQLTKKEYRLIELLLSNIDNVVPYSVIETTVWLGSYMSIDALRSLVRAIRKLTYKDIISNHNGVGYKIKTA